MSQPPGSRGHDAVRDAVSWVRREFQSDIDEWRSDRPVRRAVVGILELVFAVGILIRGAMHVGAVMASHPRRFGEVEPEVQVGLQPGHTVVRDLPLGTDVSSRVAAALYAAWFVQNPPPISPPTPTAGLALTAYFALNMGYVLLDPFWMVVDRAVYSQ